MGRKNRLWKLLLLSFFIAFVFIGHEICVFKTTVCQEISPSAINNDDAGNQMLRSYVYVYKDGTSLKFVNGVPDSALRIFYYNRLTWNKLKGKYIEIWLLPKSVFGKIITFYIANNLIGSPNVPKIVVLIDPNSEIDPCLQADDGIIAELGKLGENVKADWSRDKYGIVVDNLSGNE